jgi:hypothetical protein
LCSSMFPCRGHKCTFAQPYYCSPRHAILNLMCSLISCHLRAVLPIGLVPQVYQQKTVCSFLFSPMRIAFPPVSSLLIWSPV